MLDKQDLPFSAREQVLIDALRGIREMSLSASKGPAHVAKLTLQLMADVASEAIEKATGEST